MPVPKYEILRPAALKLLSEHTELHSRGFIDPLAIEFNLTEEEKSSKYESGNGSVFADRISWALSYLFLAGLVDRPRRGVYKINETGRELLKDPDSITPYINQRIAERDAEKRKHKEQTTQQKLSLEEVNEDATPQEKLYASFENIKKSIYQEILSTILSKTPNAFEDLVVQLLQQMGYGGEIEDAGLVTSASNDGGIDGVIKEDVLGLGRIHIQAKRYDMSNSVGRPEIQKFVGALAVASSNKGVFITTSYYSDGAIKYADSLTGNTSLVLIDGKQLAEYIYEYGLGMQLEQQFEIKRMDAEYWDGFEDESK